MKNNLNMDLNYNDESNSKSFVFIIVVILVVCLLLFVGSLFNKDNEQEEISTNNETINELTDVENNTENETVVEENKTTTNSTLTDANVSEGDFDNIISDDGSNVPEKNLLTKKDKDYEYSYYYNDNDETGNEVQSFIINGKEVIDDIGFTSEIVDVKKYKDIIAIKTYYLATCGPSHNDLFVFDYKGNILFESGSVSIEDLNKIKSDDTDEKWEKGYMTFDSYTYDETNKTLKVGYYFNISVVVNDCSGTSKTFCTVSKDNTIYSSMTLSTKLNNGKFEKENVIEKKEFNINDYDSYEIESYNSFCK